MAKNKKIENRYVSRRQFLIGTGNFMMALPPLISMMPSKAIAQVLQPKVRVFTCIGVFGIDDYQLFPDDNLAMTSTSNSSINHKNFSVMSKRISRVLDFNDPDLTGLESKTNLIRGLGLTGGRYDGHNHSILSGTHSGGRAPIYGKSIDVVIEEALGVNAIRVDTIGKATGKAGEFSFGRNNSGNRQISSLTFGDQNLFNQLFPGGMTQPPPAGGGPSKEKSIVDKVLTDLQSLMSHQRLSQSDRNTLSDYIDGANDLQRRIIASNSSGGSSCSTPSLSFEVSSGSSTVQSTNRLYDNYFDMMVLAAQCDNARVFHIANTAISDAVNNAANSELHHSASGGSDGAAGRQGWFLRRVGRLAKKLDQVTDPFDSNGKTLLDNSLIFWTNELGGWGGHLVTSLPVITFGSGGGYFRTGQYIDYRQRPFLAAKNQNSRRHVGHPYKQLLISIMRSAGLQRSQYINVGDGNGFGEFVPRFSKGDSIALDHFAQYQNTHNDPLPYVSLGG